MKKALIITLALITSHVLLANKVDAITLSLDPTSQAINVGDSTIIDLNISGLGSFAPTSLGAFLVEVVFDGSILSLDSVSYGSFLGDTDPLAFETDIFTTTTANTVSLDEGSFLFDFELDALQPDSFTLASLTFSGITIGTSSLDYGSVDLSDAIGSTLIPSLETASVSVVPEPSTMILMGSGLIGLVFYNWRRRQQTNRRQGVYFTIEA